MRRSVTDRPLSDHGRTIPVPNRLANESSPYLQQHKDNPVDWYPWGDEALAKARAEDKPIFLSIGYSSCHWCHVMEHESFENGATAELLNREFVSIKVDREERPDIDSIYMTAVQALTGHGGWPLSVFLTPDLMPFYGGTYWPPEERQGMPAFENVLKAVSGAYREKRDEVEHNAEQVKRLLTATSTGAPKVGVLDRTILDEAMAALSRQFDRRHGGFGSAPKFPQPALLEFVARRHAASISDQTATILETTLDNMASGGMYDQIGGGFHRYAVDATWTVPHFEKMLYDNAQLARVYVDAFRLQGNARYADVARDVLAWVQREMTGPDGEFYSTLDADTEGEEGLFYVWTPAEVAEAVGEADADLARAIYDITDEGNFEGRSIPVRTGTIEQIATVAGRSQDEVANKLPEIRERMHAWREQRTRPGRDEKVLASWNGMMFRAFAEAAWPLNESSFLESARRNATFIRDRMMNGEGLSHVYQNGKARVPGFLEDYANVIDGLIALYQADFDPAWIEIAVDLAKRMLERFASEDAGLLFDSASDHEPLVNRARDIQDGATPAGNTVAAEALIRLSRLTGNRDFARRGTAILAHLVRPMAEQPLGFGRALVALDTYLGTPKEVVIAGDPGDEMVGSFVRAAYARYEPHMLVGVAKPKARAAKLLPFLAERPMRNGKIAAYVCEHYSCLPPVTDPSDLSMLIERGSGVSWGEV
jgi:uncharacterized protein